MHGVIHFVAKSGATSHLVKFLPLDNAASKLKPNSLLTVILTTTPPNSPDLNPVDYAVWGALQEMVLQWSRHGGLIWT